MESEGQSEDHATTWATLVKEAANEDPAALAGILARGIRPKAEEDEDESELVAEDEHDDEEEVVVPISYEGIPSWEEAISYLVIIPPTESRGHHRGRGDHRRDDSRRR